MAPELPSFAELPLRSGDPEGSSWGVWGPDDVLGCLNLLTEAGVRSAAECVRVGKVFSLNLDLDFIAPPFFGRSAVQHVVHDAPTGHDDELRSFNTQSSTQWDGFRHVRHPVHGHYNGIADAKHGMEHWARRGIVGRAVLVDVARWRQAVGRPIRAGEADPITADDIVRTLQAQGSTLQSGDVLLIRMGWLAWYRDLNSDERADAAAEAIPSHTGVRGDRPLLEFLWDSHIAAVAADNPGFEVMPVSVPKGTRWEDVDNAAGVFLHSVVLPLLGLPIGELFDLDALAQDCLEDGRYDCMFTSAPLGIGGGVASPPNALAIK